MIRTIEKIIPVKISFLLIFCAVTDFLSYYACRLFAPFFQTRNWELPIDRMIPVVPMWTVIYFLTFLFWTVNYILISRSSYKMALRLVSADTVCKVIGFLFFVFLPCTVTRPDLDSLGSQAFLLRFLYAIDEPTTLFPSFHCLIAWLCTRALYDCKNIKLWYKIFSTVFCVLVFLSTLFTKQHVIVDVVGGMLFAELSYDFIMRTKVPEVIDKANKFMIKKFK